MLIGFDAKRVFHNHTGLGWYSRNLISNLSNIFPKNKYLLFAKGDKSNYKYSFSNKNVEIINPSGFVNNAFSSYWRTYSISKDITKNNIDIFHGLSAEIPLSLPKKLKKVVTIHDLIFLEHPKLYPFLDRNIYAIKAKYAIKNADMVIAISQQTKRSILKFIDVDPDKIFVVYQSCNDIFKSKIDEEYKDKIKKKYTLPSKFILSVGTIQERKNQLNIIKAIKDINDLNLVCVGKFENNNYKNKILKYIEQNNMSNRIYFFDKLSIIELASIYQMAMFSIYISIFEGFGIPIIESMFSQTPVISSKDGCFREVAGQYSIYVDPYDVRSIRDAIYNLYSNPTLRLEIIQKSQNHLKKFNPNNVANNIMDLYNKLLSY